MNYQYNGTNDYIKAKDKDNPLDTVSYIVWDIYRNTQDIAGLITAGWDACIRYY